MNYNRGPHPDRQAMIALLRQAVEHGVTLSNTAQVYGPLINEELAGEALHPHRNRVRVTTKFGHSIVNGKYETGKLNSRPENIRRVAEEVTDASASRGDRPRGLVRCRRCTAVRARVQRAELAPVRSCDHAKAGRIIAAGMTKGVTFEPVDGPINDRIDDAHAKYRGSQYLQPMISDRTRAATVRIIPS